MHFPYERYETLVETLTVHYPAGEEGLARSVWQIVDAAGKLLSQLLSLPMPEMEILLVRGEDWHLAPHNELEEIKLPHPYWTDETTPSSLVIPIEIDPIFGVLTPEKFAFMLYHELGVAFLEEDPRPWPSDSPLWADEWQFKFAALWLAYRLQGQQGIISTDVLKQHEEIFEPEIDGKTPDTVRSFDWYEDTSSQDYLCYELLLEQFAADLLNTYGPDILPRFLALYRIERDVILSDDVTEMLGTVLGPDGVAWLEELVYF